MNCKESDHYPLVPQSLPRALNQHTLHWFTNPYVNSPLPSCLRPSLTTKPLAQCAADT